jgi:putative aminopeptidase FrvX
MDKLLQSLCDIHSPSGEEYAMKDFLVNYIHKHKGNWKCQPLVFEGEQFQDCLILVFGEPRVAAFAHMDTTGFMVRYQDQLVPIGGPAAEGEELITGSDSFGEIECKLQISAENTLHYRFGRGITTGTSMVFKSYFKSVSGQIISPYLDNRIGIYNLLRQAETLENGALVFSCGEEAGGGSVPFLVRFLFEKYHIHKMLISDVTWATDGVAPGNGVVISRRDRNIPRKSFFDRIVGIAAAEGVNHQIEVEEEGSSDGREIHMSPYPIDWCFVGPPVEEVHTQREKASVNDIVEMMKLYQILLEKL